MGSILSSSGPFFVIALGAMVAVAAMFAPVWLRLGSVPHIPASFVTHSIMLMGSLVLMGVFSKGRWEAFGLTWGHRPLPPSMLFWTVPFLTLGLVFAFLKGRDPQGIGASKVHTIVYTWFYASLAEEFLTRGLLQSLLSQHASLTSTSWAGLSGPVVLSGLFFGAMHLILIRHLKAAAIPIIVLTTCIGLLAARYREKTGSIIPAVAIHAMFNICGMLPSWILGAFRL